MDIDYSKLDKDGKIMNEDLKVTCLSLAIECFKSQGYTSQQIKNAADEFYKYIIEEKQNKLIMEKTDKD